MTSSTEAPPFSPLSDFSEEECSDDDSEELPDEIPEDSSMTDDDLNTTGTTVAIPTATDNINIWNGYKLVGDNVDKNVRASFQRIGYTTQSLHYFHAYAVLDRVDFSGLSDAAPSPSIVDPLSFLPSKDDRALVERDLRVLISRYNCKIGYHGK